jgi:hypothetical protein
MPKLYNDDVKIRFRRGLAANINTAQTKKYAATGEPHYATDTGVLYIFNGTENVAINAYERTPSSASDTGIKGEVCYDADYLYLCVATDTWKRVALETW